MASVLAAMIGLIAFLLPWATVIGALWWLMRKRAPGFRRPWTRRKP